MDNDEVAGLTMKCGGQDSFDTMSNHSHRQNMQIDPIFIHWKLFGFIRFVAILPHQSLKALGDEDV